MTLFLPLDPSEDLPSKSTFLSAAHDREAQLNGVLKAIRKAKRIAVVSGAGISVQAGIPDFRSSEGLFQTLKRDNPKELISSGKDLFDASVFNSENTTAMFCQMIARLSELSQEAEPTPFHQLLRSLDRRSQLLRVYTQNIDALESKCGLSFGVPDSSRRSRHKAKAKSPPDDSALAGEDYDRLPSPPIEIPRCIPLHGTLQTMYCKTCTHSFPLQEHLPALISGQLALCPECEAMEQTRQLVGKRARGVGILRPGVVLYNEDHKDSERVGEVVARDLMGGSRGRSPPDLLLVVGTSLRVPGTKTIVRQFSKAVRSRDAAASSGTEGSTSRLPTPSPSPRRTPAAAEEAPIRSIYLNFDFPVPTREWEGVFDVWLKGDVQVFARMLQEAIAKEEQAKALAVEKRKQKQEQAAAAAAAHASANALHSVPTKKRKVSSQDPAHRTTKKRRMSNGTLLTPPSTPPGRLTVKLKPPSSSALTPSERYPSLVEPDDRHRTGIVICIPPRPIRPSSRPSSAHSRRRKCEVWMSKTPTCYKTYRHGGPNTARALVYRPKDACTDALSDMSDLTDISDPESDLLPDCAPRTRHFDPSPGRTDVSYAGLDAEQRPLVSPG
ncbi:DHS-like NAD/FAD-binding domain-containing protein [Punctularia strigosozonata HHB-11173 SS5]|uniref:DHS-like NAD/FAD-binding domain-containing protein n=1 Tax=Punctularia strigosozonata (strain HHB-11173) TaxID=741275 RepID=UPI00044163AF|nr:DHS-like NAD/FAD-binding domain-containing protein [Punctularia strigosozonata HHB-11173 SS5]EIN09730.1 DHS-like NAD/FAD-binding domain-containing protein [Punctularia strigosozonata HHB-11173 SS5]